MTPRLSPDLIGMPPPLDLHLVDAHADRPVGWVTGDLIGFRGFADATEATHAAWVAYRVLSRRLARTHGLRPAPIDVATLAIRREGDDEVILADGRPIAALVRPASEGRGGSDSFGFTIGVPSPADELRVRAMAHLMYRALRKSGLRWAMWTSAPAPRTRHRAAAASPSRRAQLAA